MQFPTIAINQRLAELNVSDVAPVSAIKTIHLEFGLSLADAKLAFSKSPAWTEHAMAGNQLHQEILSLLTGKPKT